MLSGIPIGLLHKIAIVCNQNSLIVYLNHSVNNFKKIPGKVIDEILKLKPVKETDEPT